jgi:hypothetical protein
VRLVEDERFEDFSHLAGRDRQHEPRKKSEQAVQFRDAANAEARQVKLPFEKARDVIAERQAAGDGERRPGEPAQTFADFVDATIERERGINEDAEDHRPQQAPQETVHRILPAIGRTEVGGRGALRDERTRHTKYMIPDNTTVAPTAPTVQAGTAKVSAAEARGVMSSSATKVPAPLSIFLSMQGSLGARRRGEASFCSRSGQEC